MEKMGIEGVGPKIIGLTLIYYVIAYFLNKSYSDSFVIVSDTGSLSWLAIILLVIGVIIWLSSVVLLLINFPKGKLITTGPFRLFLNPLYNAFVFFILPAIAIYLNAWIFFGASIVMLVLEQTLGKAEEKYLQETFGQKYEEYKKGVIFKF